MLTRFRVRVKKWVEPTQALMVPNGCSTVCPAHAHGIWHPIARPGGYVATVGTEGSQVQPVMTGHPLLHYLPTARHTRRSEVNITYLPSEVSGVCREGSRIDTVPVAIKGTDGRLLDAAIPKVTITKDASYWDDDSTVTQREKSTLSP